MEFSLLQIFYESTSPIPLVLKRKLCARSSLANMEARAICSLTSTFTNPLELCSYLGEDIKVLYNVH